MFVLLAQLFISILNLLVLFCLSTLSAASRYLLLPSVSSQLFEVRLKPLQCGAFFKEHVID